MRQAIQYRDPVNFSLITGSILLALPTFFWAGVMLEQFFGIAVIVTRIMLPFDRLSPLLSVMIMVGMPLMAILINLKSMMQPRFEFHQDERQVEINAGKRFVQWMLIMYATICIIGIMSYVYFEKFKAFSLGNFSN